MVDFDRLYAEAWRVVQPRRLSVSAESGGVGAAILTHDGHIYRGVCIDTACSMGFCAEHAAAAAMVTAGENKIAAVIAVGWDGKIMPPCGRCREFLSQLADENGDALVKVNETTVVKLNDLLPYNWQSKS
jgi:cytidine deaminase